jgi:hypothetical protein
LPGRVLSPASRPESVGTSTPSGDTTVDARLDDDDALHAHELPKQQRTEPRPASKVKDTKIVALESSVSELMGRLQSLSSASSRARQVLPLPPPPPPSSASLRSDARYRARTRFWPGQLQPYIAVFPPECMGQLACFWVDRAPFSRGAQADQRALDDLRWRLRPGGGGGDSDSLAVTVRARPGRLRALQRAPSHIGFVFWTISFAFACARGESAVSRPGQREEEPDHIGCMHAVEGFEDDIRSWQALVGVPPKVRLAGWDAPRLRTHRLAYRS